MNNHEKKIFSIGDRVKIKKDTRSLNLLYNKNQTGVITHIVYSNIDEKYQIKIKTEDLNYNYNENSIYRYNIGEEIANIEQNDIILIKPKAIKEKNIKNYKAIIDYINKNFSKYYDSKNPDSNWFKKAYKQECKEYVKWKWENKR